jgi:hypothetical protein
MTHEMSHAIGAKALAQRAINNLAVATVIKTVATAGAAIAAALKIIIIKEMIGAAMTVMVGAATGILAIIGATQSKDPIVKLDMDQGIEPITVIGAIPEIGATAQIAAEMVTITKRAAVTLALIARAA